jgi:hypothetical protein
MTDNNNTDKMCSTVTSANVGYGEDFDVPCGAKADFQVEYDLFVVYDHETGETDFWVKRSELACDVHRGQMVSYADAHPDEMQITQVHLVKDKVGNADRPDTLNK